ncbi:MAG: hypothetical protein OXL97_05110 [Chloroflexota bacterium]|nr:hypothetical protein [Chloroflexota bacterium]MDE2884042.1 hypothetical protein [Chloroflexota bacterium]
MLGTRLLSLYLMLVGLAVAVHFIVVPWYHPGGDEPYPIWELLDWFMAVAILIALVSSFIHKRRHDAGDGANLLEHISVNATFYGMLGVGILFFWNWSHLLRDSGDSDWLIWNFIDVALPLLLIAAGRRLWRASA